MCAAFAAVRIVLPKNLCLVTFRAQDCVGIPYVLHVHLHLHEMMYAHYNRLVPK